MNQSSYIETYPKAAVDAQEILR